MLEHLPRDPFTLLFEADGMADGTLSVEPLEFHASDLKVLAAIASLAAPTLDQAAIHEAAVAAARD